MCCVNFLSVSPCVVLQADVNVALTAMSLLWNAADLLSKMHMQAEDRGNSTQVLSPEDFEDLLRLLMGALQVRTPPHAWHDVLGPICHAAP